MDPDRPLFGTTFVDIDLNGGTNADIPGWLRGVIERVTNTLGTSTKKKLASENAIARLEPVDFASVSSDRCPICFEAYEDAKATKDADSVRDKETLKRKTSAMEADAKIQQLLHKEGGSESLAEKLHFVDPSLLFPADSCATVPLRFPSRNLHTFEPVREDQVILGVDKVREKKTSSECGHLAVKIPDCSHTFGKSCIVEWLKGSVTCPLCRHEVEAQTKESEVDSRRFTEEVRHEFSAEEDANSHILYNSTDMFHPVRRPPNPLVTPLTDSYMPQEWAQAHDSASELGSPETNDPALILPRKFPVSFPGFQNVSRMRTDSFERSALPQAEPRPSSRGGPERRRGGSSRSHPYFRD